ncbi:MAG: hypothetical protein CMA81_08665 [Euryarchaeota archaeon]|nr:hypothetical protein [Euryarchaeota archaeon]
MARKIPKLYPKDHPVRRLAGEIGPLPQGMTGSSAHRWKELEAKMNDGALQDSTFHKANIKGSTAVIIAPEEFSGSDHDQTFLQGVDIRTYEQATGHITPKFRTNTDYNIIRSDKIGFQVARVGPVNLPDDSAFVEDNKPAPTSEYRRLLGSPTPKDIVDINPTSSFPYSNHRFLKLDEPEYFADNYAPNASGVKGSKAQLDTSVNKNKSKIYLKHYRERRDLGQANLFQNDIPYKDTTTVNPVEIVGSEQGDQIEFPPFMVHATDLLSTDGAIEVFPIRSLADRSIPEHPYTAQGVKSDLGIIDSYRKSIVISDQKVRRDRRKINSGRTVRSFTSFLCTHANATTGATDGTNHDKIQFTVGGKVCSVSVIDDTDTIPDPNPPVGSHDIKIKRGSNDLEFAKNLEDAFIKLETLGIKIKSSRVTNTVFLREVLDRQRTKGVVISVTDVDADTGTEGAQTVTKVVRGIETVGGFQIEFSRYSDLIYEGSKTRTLSGCDYFLDGVESFGIEVLDDAERVKLLTASIDNPDSEDPDDRITLDSYIPWLVAGRSGTFGEKHIGPVNTQGFIAPEHATFPAFVDNSDDDRATVRLSDANTFSAKPNFFLTDKRSTLEGNIYSSHENLLVQSSWLNSATPFLTSSHAIFGSEPVRAGNMVGAGDDDNLKQDSIRADTSIIMTSATPENKSTITVTDSLGGSKTYIFGDKEAALSTDEVEVDIASSVTVDGSEYRNSIIGSRSSNLVTKEKGTSIDANFTAMPADGSSVVVTMPVYDRTNPASIMTATVKRTYVFRIEGETGSLEGNNIVVNRGLTVAETALNFKAAIELRHADTKNNTVSAVPATATIVSAAGNTRSTAEVAAIDLDVGTRYTITFVGDTDFTKLGSPSNTVGTSFIATSAATDASNGSTVEVGGFAFGHGTTFGDTITLNDASSVAKTYQIVNTISDADTTSLGSAYTPLKTGDVIGSNAIFTGIRSSQADALTVNEIANGHTLAFNLAEAGGGTGSNITIKIVDTLPNTHTANEIAIKTSAATRDNLVKAINGIELLDSDNEDLIEYAASGGGQVGTGIQGLRASPGSSQHLVSLEVIRPGNHTCTLTDGGGGSIGTSASVTGGSIPGGSSATAGRIAIAIGASNSQPDFLDQLKIAVESAGGHNGSILGSKSGEQTLILTQAIAGASGNDKAISHTTLPAAYTVPTKFTGGVSTPLSVAGGKITLRGIDPDGGTGNLSYSKNITAQNVRDAVNLSQGDKITAALFAPDSVSLIQNIVQFNRKGNTAVTVTGQTNTAIFNGTEIVIPVRNGEGGVSLVENESKYQIVSLGDTNNWNAFGASTTPTVGEVFTANSTLPTMPAGGTHGKVLGPLSVNGKFDGGTAFSLSNSGARGSATFKKTSVYFPESGHFAFKSNQGRTDSYPAVCVISGSHHFSGRKHSEDHDNPEFSTDAPWTVSYWMSGSDRRADHFCSVRDIINFRDTTLGEGLSYDTVDHYPNVPNFKVRHFVSRNYGFLYVSLYDNDFYPSNHHRVDFIFAGVKKGSSFRFLRNSDQENSLYNTLLGGNSWNHLAVSYDGGMHSTTTGGSSIYKPSSTGTKYENFLQALENEDRADTDTVTHGPNITVQSSATLVDGEKYVIISLGDITPSDWQSITGVSESETPQRGTIFTYNNYNLSGVSGTGIVRLKADTYFDSPTINDSGRTILYNYGSSQYEPYVVTGSIGGGKLACPIRLHLNGVDITDNSLEYIVHYSTRTTGHSARYGLGYTTESGTSADATINYTGLPLDGNTIQLVSADNTSKTYEFDDNGSVSSGNTQISMHGEKHAIVGGNINTSDFTPRSAEGATGIVLEVLSASTSQEVDGASVPANQFKYLTFHSSFSEPDGRVDTMLLANRPLMPGEEVVISGYFFNGGGPVNPTVGPTQAGFTPIVVVFETDPEKLSPIQSLGTGFLNHPDLSRYNIGTGVTPGPITNEDMIGQGIVPKSNGSNVGTTTGWKYNTSGRTAPTDIFAQNRLNEENQEDATLHTLLYGGSGDNTDNSNYTFEQVKAEFESRFYSITIRNDTSNPAYLKLGQWDISGNINDSSGKRWGVHDLRFDYAGDEDTQYALLSHIITDKVYGASAGIGGYPGVSSQNHHTKLTTAHNPLTNTVNIIQSTAGIAGNGKAITSTLENASVETEFLGGMAENLNFRDIKFTGEVYTRAQANAASLDGTKAFSGHTVMSSSIVFGGDPNAVSFNKRLFKNSTFFPTATVSYTGQPEAGNSITIISTDTTSRQYVFVLPADTKSGGAALGTGEVLEEGDQVGGSALAAGDSKITGIAVEIHTDDADATYSNLKTAINHSSGHTSSNLSVTHTDNNKNIGAITFTQVTEAASGNTDITAELSNASVPKSFINSESTYLTRRVHAKQNTNYISEFALWDKKLPESQIKSVWELSRFNDVLFTVEKPMAAALTRMNASFEDGVENNHTHASKGFIFGDSEHGTDSIVFGGLKK